MTKVSDLPWWEREKLLTKKDREEIQKAKGAEWSDIDENAAETEAGRYELHCIIMRKYHSEEYLAGLL